MTSLFDSVQFFHGGYGGRGSRYLPIPPSCLFPGGKPRDMSGMESRGDMADGPCERRMGELN